MKTRSAPPTLGLGEETVPWRGCWAGGVRKEVEERACDEAGRRQGQHPAKENDANHVPVDRLKSAAAKETYCRGGAALAVRG